MIYCRGHQIYRARKNYPNDFANETTDEAYASTTVG